MESNKPLTTNMELLDMRRKELGVSQDFMSTCLGMSSSVWSTWKNSRKEIPEKHLPKVKQIFSRVQSLKQGHDIEVIKRKAEDDRIEAGKQVCEVIDALLAATGKENTILFAAYKNMGEQAKDKVKELL